MGTNYYLETDFCPCCGKPRETIHIGKSSIGWRFLFYKYSQNIRTIEDVKRMLFKGILKDEYGRTTSKEDFWELVESRQQYGAHNEIVIDGYDFCESEFS